ncbi:MAG: putative PEP-binding protein [Candidatus Xenobia bacterium]
MNGSGLAYSRNYQTGVPRLSGVFFPEGNRRAARPLSVLDASLQDALRAEVERLERELRRVPEVSYEVADQQLHVVTWREAALTPRAAVRIAVEMARQGVISRSEAVLRVRPKDVDVLVAPALAAASRHQALAEGRLMARGVAVFQGAVCGQMALDSEQVMARLQHDDTPQILVTEQVLPTDEVGLYNAAGILVVGGSPHAPAVQMARRWSVPCVQVEEPWPIDRKRRTVQVGGRCCVEGTWISLDGSSGEVFHGSMNVVDDASLDPYLEELLGWADEMATMQVHGNADTAEEIARACAWGAQGIGLVRMENVPTLGHLPFRHLIYPLLVLAPQAEGLRRQGRTDAPEWQRYVAMLADIEQHLVEDFVHLFEAVGDKPITVRLLDSPLSASLPSVADLRVDVLQRRLQRDLGAQDEEMWAETPSLLFLGRDRETLTVEEREALLPGIRRLEQHNPGFGLRVCRQGIIWPEIYRVELRALFVAAQRVPGVHLQIMVPGVSHPNELSAVRAQAAEVAAEVRAAPYRFGTMIEMPRACLVADELAAMADFFWFGTIDLTQATWGYSTNDAAYRFLPDYLDEGVLEADPFSVLDEAGVGHLMRMAVTSARAANRKLMIGICGNQGAEPASIRFCQELGIEAVSTTCRRVPGARLAAAQAALSES